MRKKIFHLFCTFGVTAIVMFLIVEVFLRLFHSHIPYVHFATWIPETNQQKYSTLSSLLQSTRAPYQPHQCVTGQRLDEYGFNTEHYNTEKNDAYRIVALGDSFTFSSGGVERENLWHAIVGGKIEQSYEADVEVINLGVSATGTRLAKRVYELEGNRLHPDLVLLGFFMGNDFTDEEGSLEPKPSWKRTLRRSFVVRLVHFVTASGDAVKHVNKIAADRECPEYTNNPNDPTFSEASFLQHELIRAVTFHEYYREEVLRRVQNQLTVIEDLQRQVQDNGGELVVVLIPDELQVSLPLQKQIRELMIDASQFDPKWLQDTFASELRNLNIHTIDLLPAFTESNDVLYQLRDTHWNEEGNVLAADTIYDYLRQQGILNTSRDSAAQ